MERRTSIARFFLSTALVAALVCPAGFATAGPAKKSATKTEAKAAPEAKPAAEASAAAAPSQEEMMAAMMKNAAPGPEHAALNPLVGSWKTTTKMWNAPGTEPTVSAGTCERAWTMGNRYLVAKGEYKSVVLYWYQSRDRVVASEYRAKMFTAVDAMRYNRTDTALVRVVVPVPNGDSKAATDAAIDFVRDFSIRFGHFRA